MINILCQKIVMHNENRTVKEDRLATYIVLLSNTVN